MDGLFTCHVVNLKGRFFQTGLEVNSIQQKMLFRSQCPRQREAKNVVKLAKRLLQRFGSNGNLVKNISFLNSCCIKDFFNPSTVSFNKLNMPNQNMCCLILIPIYVGHSILLNPFNLLLEPPNIMWLLLDGFVLFNLCTCTMPRESPSTIKH